MLNSDNNELITEDQTVTDLKEIAVSREREVMKYYRVNNRLIEENQKLKQTINELNREVKFFKTANNHLIGLVQHFKQKDAG